MDERAISFGSFRLLPSQRLLLEGDQPMRLGSRAFDILAVLAENAGRVVPKEELIARVWPKVFVEESNLKIQVSALRRALGDGQGGNRYIVTVPGRGYEFVVPVGLTAEPTAIPAPVVPQPGTHNLPLAMTRMIGREEAVATLVSRLSRERLLTIVGPGGIGKTTVALAVAERMIADYQHGVWLVDLAPLGDPRLVPSAVAGVLGLEIHTENLLPELVANLGDKRMLLVLDTCEHVIDMVASLAAAILNTAPNVNILATSREAIRIAGERGYRLGPLATPLAASRSTAAEATVFPAVQLFVERVSAVVEDFALSNANAPLVAEICRRLDGLPLAIELAAPRVGVLGIEGLAAHLADSLRVLGARRRSAVSRHRTMRAVVDWSYGLLRTDEQQFIRALAIFTGGFTVEAATAVAKDAPGTSIDAIDGLADLVTKSLIVADVSGANPRFRLLDTTRAYAIEQLDTSGEREPIARRHAEYLCRLFESAESEALARPADEWLADYAPEIDNLRAALDWALSPGGDLSIGAALTAAAFPLWMRLSLLEECCGRTKQALSALGTAATDDPRSAMRLNALVGAATREASEMGEAFTKTLDLAKRLGDVEYQLRALRGMHFYHVGSGQFRAAHPFAEAFHELSLRGSDRNDLMLGESMLGMTEHYIGHQMRARHHLERALAGAVIDHAWDAVHFQDVVRFGSDLRITARVFLARVLWLQGFANQALRAVDQSLGEAETTGHAISQSLVLAMAACPIAFWVGDQNAAARYAATLIDLSQRHALPYWTAYGVRFEQVLLVKPGGLGSRSRRRAVDANFTYFNFRSLTVLMELAKALGQVGRIAEALEAAEAGIEQFEPSCFTPEVLRLKGELLLLQPMPGASEIAGSLFRQALDGARERGTLSWELRAAISLAKLLRDQDRTVDAIACLQPIYDRFTEGFGTADLKDAKALLEELT